MANTPVLPQPSAPRGGFTRFWTCLWLNEKQVITGLALCSIFFAAQCALGIVFGWSLAWKIVGGIGLPWVLLPALAVKTKLPTIMMGTLGLFLGQEITSIVAINYAQNVFFDKLAVALNSVFLVSSVIGMQLAGRFRKIHTPDHPFVGATAPKSPLSSVVPVPPV